MESETTPYDEETELEKQDEAARLEEGSEERLKRYYSEYSEQKSPGTGGE